MTIKEALKEARKILQELSNERGGAGVQTRDVIQVARMLLNE